jgi:glycogen debranching enzyme
MTSRLDSRWLAAATLLVCATGVGRAQEPPHSVPKFAIESSPIGLRYDVRPQQYVGVLGRRAAWLGKETGEAELWVHPLKLASDFQLSFRIPDYMEPIRGSDVARTVEIRPELTTITYTHATFTVREHILAPTDEPGLLVLLDVETFRPLEIVASFRMVFQYAWPAAFGGQYVFWNEGERAFVVSESLRERNGVIGSPWAVTASSHPAHALPDAPNTFIIPVDTVRAAREYIPIAIAAGIAPRDSVLAVYHRLLDEPERHYHEKLDHATTLLAHTTRIDTPDDALDLAFAWSKVNLDESVVCNPDLGCGLVAGWGPSGTGTRPGFGWFFGGDAAINSFAMQATGMWDQVAQGLRFLARYARQDGKIPHEISQAAARIPWFTDFPYTYYHGDTTPYWIVAVWRYWRATGDDVFLNDLWPAVQKAYAWCRTRDTDGDGIIENGPGNLGAIEIGALGEGMHEDIYLAAVWIEALEAMGELAAARGEVALARETAELHARAAGTLNTRYWRSAEGHHAFGILESGGTNDNLTVWPATAAAFQLLDEERADRTLTKLATDSITADWGARILSTGSALYDPMHYNNGAVWPFVTGFVIWGQYNYRRPWSGYPLIDALVQVTFDWARGRHPELLSGRYYRPLDTAVPQQFFATSMLLSPVMSGLLGWEPNAPRGRARLAPQLPPSWDHVSVLSLLVGSTVLDADIHQTPGRFAIAVRRSGPPIDLTVAVSLPPGARLLETVVEPVAGGGPGRAAPTARETVVEHTLRLDAEVTRLSLTWNGGLAVEPPTMDLLPGQESDGIRVLDFRRVGDADRGEWQLTTEGAGGKAYRLRLYGVPLSRADGARVTGVEGNATTIEIEMPDAATTRTTATIHLFAQR